MIIDADTHITNYDEGNSISASQLIEQMDLAGIDKSLTWIQPPYIRSNLPSTLRYLYSASKEFSKRIIPFGWADPHLGIEESKELIRRSIEEYGFMGIKLNGAQNEFPIDSDYWSIPLVEEIARHQAIVAFHCGADVRDYTHPYRMRTVVKKFPDTHFFMIHMGGASFMDFSEAAIDVAAECPNITLIGSAIRSIPLIKAITVLGPERIAFGSDAPFEIPYIEVAKYKAILKQEFPASYYDLVMGQTIGKHLKISAI